MRASIVESKTMRLPLNGKSIEVSIYTLPSADNTILLLHEALGSVSYWKDFPHRLALATGSNVLVYSRPGHGNSEGPLEPRNEGHYLDQVEVVIPQLLRHFSVERPVIYGHSEREGFDFGKPVRDCVEGRITSHRKDGSGVSRQQAAK
jgi:pimeloyl-ACP methyl ester carboxylesterase